MRQFVDILSISTRGRGLVEITREVELAQAARRPGRALDPVLPAHLGRIAHTGKRRAGRSFRSGGVFRSPRPRRRSISALGRRRRRHARPHPRHADRRATRGSDLAGPARSWDLARYLSVRASACAASARDRVASHWRMTGGSHKTMANPQPCTRNSPEITRHKREEVSVDETSMTPGTPYFAGRFATRCD